MISVSTVPTPSRIVIIWLGRIACDLRLPVIGNTADFELAAPVSGIGSIEGNKAGADLENMRIRVGSFED